MLNVYVPIVTTSKKSAKSMTAPSEMELITMLFTVEGRGGCHSPWGFLFGWLI